MSPSIARSPRSYGASASTPPSRMPSARSGIGVPGAEGQAAPSSHEHLERPPGPQIEQVEGVGGEHQHPHRQQVLAGRAGRRRESTNSARASAPTAFSSPVDRPPRRRAVPCPRQPARGAGSPRRRPAPGRRARRPRTQERDSEPVEQHRRRVAGGEHVRRPPAPRARPAGRARPARQRRRARPERPPAAARPRQFSRTRPARSRRVEQRRARARRPQARSDRISGQPLLGRNRRSDSGRARRLGNGGQQALRRALDAEVALAAEQPPDQSGLPGDQVQVVHARDAGGPS